MAIEPNVEYIDDLNQAWPTPADPKSEGDDHLRNMKKVLKQTFPNFSGAMTIAHDQVASKQDIAEAQFESALPDQALGFLRSTGAAATFGQTHTGYAQKEVRGADIASAATINLTTATGNYVHITGSAGPVTAVTVPSGAAYTLYIEGTPTFQHSAALSLPGGVNIVAQAGDRMTLRGDTSGAVVTSYTRASGKALMGGVELLGTATISAPVATVDFLNVFSAAYDAYTVEIMGITGSLVLMHLAIGGVPDNGATAYTITMAPGDPATTGTNSYAQLCSEAGSGTRGANLTVKIMGVNQASKIKSIRSHSEGQTAATPGWQSIDRVTIHLTTGVVTGFRLFPSSGTFASGTIQVYGHRNS